MLFEVGKIPWKMERQQERSQQKRVQAMIRKKKMEILKNSNYLIIRAYLSMWDTGSLSVQWISRMQRKQLRATGFPESFDNFFACQQGRWYRWIHWIRGRVKLVSHQSHATVQRSIALHSNIRPAVRVTWGCGEAPLPELVTTRKTGPRVDGLSPWELPLLFPKTFFRLLGASGSSALLLVLPLWGARPSGQRRLNKQRTTAGGLPPWFIHCGPRFYFAKLLYSQYKFNAVSDTVYGYCTLTFNYIKSYYNHFLYNKSSLTPEKLSSHGCSAVFLKSKTEEF